MTCSFNNSFFSWNQFIKALITVVNLIVSLWLFAVLCNWIFSLEDPSINIINEATKYTLRLVSWDIIIIMLMVMLPASFNKYILTDEYLYVKEYGLFGKNVDLTIEVKNIKDVQLDSFRFWDYYARKRILIRTNETQIRLNAFNHKRELYNELCNRIKKELK